MISFEAQSYLKRYQQLILPSVALVVVVLLTVVVLVPQALKIVADFRSMADLRKQVGALTEKATLLTNLDQGELTVRAREVIADVPLDEDIGYFVGSVRSMVERSGVKLSGVELVGATDVEASPAAQAAQKSTRVSANTSPKSRKEQFIPFKIGVEGNLTALRQLLTEISVSVPLNEMESFGFGRDVGEENFGGFVSLNFYYSPQPKTLGTSEQPLVVITAAEENAYEQLAQFHEPATSTLPEVQTGQKEFIR